ncbi:hypothetical protein Shyhy01_16410 [Streptomyces hygroscopicus subsp. hygroscopicus]|nr:hypothetical protein Shyhy01_16410 [Streptomyces hygroscopicus subsp. hygroscopicus]
MGDLDAGGAGPVGDRRGDGTGGERAGCGGGRQILDEGAGCGVVVLYFGDIRGGFTDGRVGAPGQQVPGCGQGWLAEDCDLWLDDVWIVDSTPVECARSRETVKRSDLAGCAGYGYCRSHSRFYWGLSTGA